uniref:Uncharacterized protein n=1 Tax=Leersia perrieri TaxID=77586 RepID=A0A0D9XCV0_9ORYZ
MAGGWWKTLAMLLLLFSDQSAASFPPPIFSHSRRQLAAATTTACSYAWACGAGLRRCSPRWPPPLRLTAPAFSPIASRRAYLRLRCRRPWERRICRRRRLPGLGRPDQAASAPGQPDLAAAAAVAAPGGSTAATARRWQREEAAVRRRRLPPAALTGPWRSDRAAAAPWRLGAGLLRRRLGTLASPLSLLQPPPREGERERESKHIGREGVDIAFEMRLAH